ncbi:IMPACT family protein [Gordonia paraffinivorans]|uniref:IMPACT family protein n=1 Tax=Gordonia paraffinivorans TaxID=175628 RepID=UPI001B357CA7|nr:YigZ family protein [Gordonia paraffinivorans]
MRDQGGSTTESAVSVLAAVGTTYVESLTVKRSRFVATVTSIGSESDFRGFLDAVRGEHHGVHHACWAFSLGTGARQVTRSSDDGEPTGTAGPPILAALQTRHVTNAAIVVVRYYGGIQLGTGGLVRAYGSVARAALDGAPLRAAKSTSRVRFSVPIADAGRIEQAVHAMGAVRASDYRAHSVSFLVEVDASDEETLCDRVMSLTSGAASIVDVDRVVA